ETINDFGQNRAEWHALASELQEALAICPFPQPAPPAATFRRGCLLPFISRPPWQGQRPALTRGQPLSSPGYGTGRIRPRPARRGPATSLSPQYKGARLTGFEIVVAGAKDFLQGGESRNCFGNTVFEQGPHAQEAGLAPDGLRRLAVEGHVAQGAGPHEHLEDALTAAIAGVITVRATPAAHEVGGRRLGGRDARGLQFGRHRLVRLLAFGADNAYQALGHDGDHTA